MFDRSEDRRIVTVRVGTEDVRCVQLGAPFTLRGVQYPAGSWLLQAPSWSYAQPMTNVAFETWRATHEGAAAIV